MKKLILFFLACLLVALPAYAQKSFEMRFNEAAEYYTNKQYDKAIATLEAAKKSPGVTAEQKSKADALLNQCRAAKQKLNDLTLSKETLIMSGDGQRDSIYVTAGKKWNVTSAPEWCSTSVDNDVLFVTVEPNLTGKERKGMIMVSMGKERTAILSVTQEERAEAIRLVHIRTVPERAIIYIDQNSGMLADRFELREGKHNVRIEKSGFERKEMVLNVDRNATDEELFFTIPLDPTFAAVSVTVEPEDGYVFDAEPKLDISGNQVSLRPSTVNSFNQDKDIRYYEMYEDNIIPLYPGSYRLRAESEGFKSASEDITVVRGETRLINFTLKAICGTLSLQDAENATGARVFIDGREVGEIPIQAMKIKTGEHVLRVVKPGYQAEKEEFPFVIEEGKDRLMNISMKSYVTYNLTSTPAYCKVTVDGEYAGTTPIKLELMEGAHEIKVEKEGYYTYQKQFDTDLSKPEQDLAVHLDKTYPLAITSDKDSLVVTISKGMGNNKTIYVDNVKTPASVALPLSKGMYHLKLTRNFNTAYNGYFWFKQGKRDHIHVLSYSEEGIQIIGVNMYLKKPASIFHDVSTPLQKDFQRIGDASLGKLKLFSGLTTTAAKATIFWETSSSQQIHYPANSAGNFAVDPGDAHYKPIKMLPAFSTLLINEEFRLGGAVHNNVDVNMLATYAWYPNLSKLLPFTHMSGHDIFLGAEISSRIPIFNANIRFGWQAFYGQANICRPKGVYSGSPTAIERYYQEKCTVPYNKAEFVVTVGFTLGYKDSKGNNILRVF